MKRNKKNSPESKFRIGSHIRKWRNIKDIKQKDLAFALHISEAAVSNIENDLTNITLAQLEEISTALQISIDQLLSDPQERIENSLIAAEDKVDYFPADRALINAIISSIEKKDEQLQLIMQNFLQAISSMIQKERPVLNSSKQEASRV